MADALGNSFLIVVLPLYIASDEIRGHFFDFSEPLVTGVILGLFGIASSLLQPVFGRLSDLAGKRRDFVLLGLFLFAAANLSFLAASSYLSLMFVRVGQGIAAALTITASLALVSEVSVESNRGAHMGTYNAFRLVGFGIGPLVAGSLVEAGPYSLPLFGVTSGFEAAFLFAAFAAFVSFVLVFLLVENPEHIQPGGERMLIRFRSSDSQYYLDPIFALGLATFVMSSGLGLLAPIEAVVNERLAQGPFLFSVEFSALIGVMAVLQPLLGKASDALGRKRFILVGLIGLIPFTLAQGLATEPWHMIAARALQGVSAALIFGPALALAGDLAEQGQTAARLSVLSVCFGLGISFGAFASGYSVRFGFAVPFIFGAVLAACGVVLVATQVPDDARGWARS